MLARNVEANLHLFAQDGRSPSSDNDTDAAATAAAAADDDDAAATTEATDATLDDSDIDSSDGSAPDGAGGAEERNMRGGRDRRRGGRPRGRVAAVRQLDWFTLSQEEGPTDSAICPQVRGSEKGGGFHRAVYLVWRFVSTSMLWPRLSGGCCRGFPVRTRLRARFLRGADGTKHLAAGKTFNPWIDHDLYIYRSPCSSPARCERLCSIFIVQIQPRKHALDHAGCTGPTRQHELDHTRSRNRYITA